MGGPANKGIYKYIRNRIYRINEKEGNRNYPNGDLTKEPLLKGKAEYSWPPCTN